MTNRTDKTREAFCDGCDDVTSDLVEVKARCASTDIEDGHCFDCGADGIQQSALMHQTHEAGRSGYLLCPNCR